MSHSTPRRSRITRDQLVALFAQPEHHARLGRTSACRAAARGILRMPQHVERARVIPARPHAAIKTRHRFDIVVVDIDRRRARRSRRSRTRPGSPAPALRRATRRSDRFDRARGGGKMRGAAVGQIVAIDRRHHDVLQAQPRDRLRDPARLVGIERAHLAVRDRAVRAIARAYVAHQHEGGGAMRKAFADIRAARLLADRMQLQLAENRFGAKIFGRHRRAHFDPVGMFAFSASTDPQPRARRLNESAHSGRGLIDFVVVEHGRAKLSRIALANSRHRHRRGRQLARSRSSRHPSIPHGTIESK